MTPISKLFLPNAELAGCMFGGIFRDTRGVSLPSQDRVNHFPASPLVTVSKIFHGTLFLLPAQAREIPTDDAQRLASLSVMGPQTTPLSSWSPDSVTVLTVGFYYDAWLLLGGDTEFKAVPTPILNAFEQLDCPDKAGVNWIRFCETLAAAWTHTDRGARSHIGGIADWAQALSMRAAMSTAGRSLRSAQRFIKRKSGQTQRTLDFFSTLEHVHRQRVETPDTPLAEFAIDTGFSDQAHMGRAIRRLTGFSPAALNKAIETEEPFWCYRLLGERF